MNKRNSKEWLSLKRTVRFGETDSAGVMHFFQLIRWCHEAWEESLEKYGIYLQEIFPTTKSKGLQLQIALPVVHCEAKYFKPLYVGDNINIDLHPEKLSESSFVIRFNFKKNDVQIGIGHIKHVSINSISREKCQLSKSINSWLEESF